MKHQRRFDTATAAREDVVHLRILIADINRVVQILDSDIVSEESRAGVSECSQINYPMLARTLAARRDNLRTTIAALEQRLVNLPAKYLEPA